MSHEEFSFWSWLPCIVIFEYPWMAQENVLIFAHAFISLWQACQFCLFGDIRARLAGILLQPTLVVAPWIGDSFCCWFMIDCTIQLWIHRGPWPQHRVWDRWKAWIHDFVSVTHLVELLCWFPQFLCDSHLEFRKAAGTSLWPVLSYTHVVPSTPVCFFLISSYHLPND